MVSDRKTRVGIVGASGIGKHHAKWWHLEGAGVCGFVGTSADSVAKTRAALEKMFPFTGRAYTSLEDLLRAEAPDIVDVCSPPQCHYAHVRAALQAGCHVLCEKPFVYDAALPRATLMDQAQELAGLAAGAGARLGVCTQYSSGAGMLRRIWNETHPGELITRFRGHIESPARGREPNPARVWVDLAPHPLSVLQKLVPDGTPQWDTLATNFNGYKAAAEFEVARTDGAHVHCEIIARNAETGGNVRCVYFNNFAFAIEGENDAEGVYCARIDTDAGSWREPDMMRLLIRNFLAGQPDADADAALVNLDWLLTILDVAQAFQPALPGQPRGNV